jgi:hypothetical protein
LYAPLFLKETANPYLTVGMGVGKRLEEGWRAFKVKVDGTDKRGHRIKGVCVFLTSGYDWVSWEQTKKASGETCVRRDRE